jgi:hypothetical protein
MAFVKYLAKILSTFCGTSSFKQYLRPINEVVVLREQTYTFVCQFLIFFQFCPFLTLLGPTQRSIGHELHCSSHLPGSPLPHMAEKS